jgi:hypothetical protein
VDDLNFKDGLQNGSVIGHKVDEYFEKAWQNTVLP